MSALTKQVNAKVHARDVCLDAAVRDFCAALRWIDRGGFLSARRHLLNAEVWAIDAQLWLGFKTDEELRRANAE